jgi:hypothetical protein
MKAFEEASKVISGLVDGLVRFQFLPFALLRYLMFLDRI